MKRIIISISLIILAILICFFSNWQVKTKSEKMQIQLKEIGTVISSGDEKKAESLLEEAEKNWEKTETIFSFIVDADKIEEMNIGFSMIKAHLKDKNKEHALERLRECDLLLGEIAENEKLSIKNIM